MYQRALHTTRCIFRVPRFGFGAQIIALWKLTLVHFIATSSK